MKRQDPHGCTVEKVKYLLTRPVYYTSSLYSSLLHFISMKKDSSLSNGIFFLFKEFREFERRKDSLGIVGISENERSSNEDGYFF